MSIQQKLAIKFETTKSQLLEHPASLGETYLQHMAEALVFGIKMISGGLACLIHAVLPFLFVNTGSLQVKDLYTCLLYTSPSPRDLSTSRMPSSA